MFAARDDRHAIVLASGRFALPALVRYDLQVVLGRPRATDAAAAAKPRAPRPYGAVGAAAAALARGARRARRA